MREKLKAILSLCKAYDFPKTGSDNVIFLHTNAFRTAFLKRACAKNSGVCACLEHIPTPAGLEWIIGKEQRVVISGEMFSMDADYEKVVGEAIAKKECCFIILTNNINEIPESIRSKMRVMK